jgi:ABC-type multidrug transport system ATPase subunit
LQVDGLCFAYPQRALFTDWSTRISPGLTLVHGGDGCGKTTLLAVLSGQLAAQAGRLSINGVSLSDSPEAYRRQVFWADPGSSSFDQVSAAVYFKSIAPEYPGFDLSVLQHLTQAFELTPHVDKPLYMLSTGSKRKVWLAAAFASGAAVTLLDQPFAALDKSSVGVVMACLAEAASHPSRICILAHYERPDDLALAQVIELA